MQPPPTPPPDDHRNWIVIRNHFNGRFYIVHRHRRHKLSSLAFTTPDDATTYATRHISKPKE